MKADKLDYCTVDEQGNNPLHILAIFARYLGSPTGNLNPRCRKNEVADLTAFNTEVVTVAKMIVNAALKANPAFLDTQNKEGETALHLGES